MKIHEYQANQLLDDAGVTVLPGIVIEAADEATDAFEKLGASMAVVKAQVHAGGRGKGRFIEYPDRGGVELVKNAEEARQASAEMLGSRLVTIQTGEEGQTVRKVYVKEALESIPRELYLGIVLDRAAAKPAIMVSSEGGVEIEKVAAETPEKIFREHFDPHVGIESYQIRKLCKKLDITGASVRKADKFIKALCRLFVDRDCSLVEINPLVITESGDLLALDSKITFDENALYRQKDLVEMRDTSEEEPAEIQAAEAGLSYIKLDGNIGCLVNGAGLAMSTMDIIKHHGGEPANFLDVGGSADTEAVIQAFRILLDDKNTKAVLVNIFGGIMQCTTIANAIVEAYKTVGFNVPLVVRLEGTEVEEGRKILENADVDIITASDLTDAATKVVAAANQ